MPSVKKELKGSCGAMLTGAVWKQGHSIKCERRGASAVRYWKPDKRRYPMWKLNDKITDYAIECWDFCRTCRLREDKIKENSG